LTTRHRQRGSTHDAQDHRAGSGYPGRPGQHATELLSTRWTGEFEQLSRDLLFSVDALLYGRVSYENHAKVWPTLEEAFGDYAVRMNTIPKHVASRTLTEVQWNATLLGDDVVDAVRKLKEQPGGDILKIGTGGSFSRTLLAHRLVDEYLFWLFPVIARQRRTALRRDRHRGLRPDRRQAARQRHPRSHLRSGCPLTPPSNRARESSNHDKIEPAEKLTQTQHTEVGHFLNAGADRRTRSGRGKGQHATFVLLRGEVR
jgi:dihydrofolate reductase